MRAFDTFDYEVVKAHGIAAGTSNEGLAPTSLIRHHHRGPLPVQRLSGMARRGLMHYDHETGEWAITSVGVRLAHTYRDALASARQVP